MSKRFKVTVALDVQEHVDGELNPFFGSNVVYHELPYDALVAIEQHLLKMLQRLGDEGVAKAYAMGLGERLQALGVAQGCCGHE